MVSLIMSFTPAATTTNTRVFAATATKGTSSGSISSKEEKGFLDWIIGGMTKEDQFYETDPILKKVEEKSGTGTTSGRSKNTVAIPQKKKGGGFGGLFAKN